MHLRKEVSELLAAGVVDQETAERIEQYYQSKSTPSQNKLVIIFGIIGALLVGLGVVLIVTYNWHNLSRLQKNIVAFLPMILGQLVCGYVLWKQKDSITWREGSATFLILAISGCLSLINLIYNIAGSMESFLLVWVLLTLPVAYVMRSSFASLFYIIGITWYGCEAAYWGYSDSEDYLYWGLLLLILPFYIIRWKQGMERYFLIAHHWLLPLSVIICLGTLADEHEEFLFVAYMSLFGFLYLLGHSTWLENEKLRHNGYKVLGAIGTVTLLLIMSFDGFWQEMRERELNTGQWPMSPEGLAAIVLTAGALFMLWRNKGQSSGSPLKPAETVFLVFIVIFITGLYSPVAPILINMVILMLSLLTIREGVKANHFGILNYGLLIITLLIFCRFFDSDIHAIFKGLLFVAVGFAFFIANYLMARQKKLERLTKED